MSIEDSINKLADAINALAAAINSSPSDAETSAAPRRGRPPGKAKVVEDMPAPAAATPTPVAAEVPAPAPVAAPAPVTLDEVRAALVALKEKDGNRDRCVVIIKLHTGQEVLTGISESAYAPILEDVRKLL